MTRTALLPALLLSLSLVAAGCGDGGDEPKEAAPISKADFTTKVEKICADGNADLQAAAEELGEDPSDEQIAQFASDTMVPNLQQQHDDIEALGAPEGDEEDVDALLEALQEGIDAVEADPGSITSSDPFTEANDLATAYGLEGCAG